jgi:alanyl-tRNA synthetase
MGFERVAGLHATTKGFKDFTSEPSNYNADIFAPFFKKIAELSKKEYRGTVPAKREGLTEQENIDVAFRVLADHARCVSCAIADGILPSNDGRNYVVRRILRRGILYGTKLGLKTGFFEQLVAPVVESLGTVFPELKHQQNTIQRVIRAEEEAFGRTLERGLRIFEDALDKINAGKAIDSHAISSGLKLSDADKTKTIIAGAIAFELYDTYGFPLDMTQLLAAERGLTVDVDGFNQLMNEQRERGRAAQKKEIIVAATEGEVASDQQPTKFIGYDRLTADAKLIDVVKTGKATFLVFDQTPFYAEMGGQAGDHGAAKIAGQTFAILDVVKDKAGRHLHKLAPACAHDIAKLNLIGQPAQLGVSPLTRRAISRHHTAAHLVHWALRKVLGTHVRQAGTSKTKHHLRFDFLHFEQVKPEQLREIEHLVNDKVLDNAPVSYAEVPYSEVKGRPDVLQFFGDKYGDRVRVVQIGGEPAKLNGYSMELCGGTHAATTGEIGIIKFVAEMAIAAGTRRIEAVAGQPAYDFVQDEEDALKAVNAKLNAGSQDVAKKLDALLAQKAELEKQLKVFQQKAASGLADDLVAKATTRDGLKFVSAVVTTDAPDSLRALGGQVLSKLGEGVVQLGASFGDKATVIAFCSPAAIKAGHQAGKIVQALSVQLGGKGGGKPDFAMGGGKDVAKLAEILK